MNQENQSPLPPLVEEIVPVAAQQLRAIPNRQMRNQAYTELGSLKMEEGNVRVLAYQKDGSLLIIMPDQSGFLIDTSIAATQCYKYWKLKQAAGTPEAANQPHEQTQISQGS